VLQGCTDASTAAVLLPVSIAGISVQHLLPARHSIFD